MKNKIIHMVYYKWIQSSYSIRILPIFISSSLPYLTQRPGLADDETEIISSIDLGLGSVRLKLDYFLYC